MSPLLHVALEMNTEVEYIIEDESESSDVSEDLEVCIRCLREISLQNFRSPNLFDYSKNRLVTSSVG